MAELPEPWNTAAEKAGVRQTYRGIDDKAGLSHVTVRRLISEGRTSRATVEKVALALNVDATKVYQWAEIELSEWGPWRPREAHKLNPRARAALEELIRAVTQGGGSDGLAAEAQKTPPAAPAAGVNASDERYVRLVEASLTVDRVADTNKRADQLGE